MFYLSAKADYNLSVGKISSFAYNNKNRAHFVFKQKIHRARPKAERIEGGAKRGAPPTFAIGSEFEFYGKRSLIRNSQKSRKSGSGWMGSARALQSPD